MRCLVAILLAGLPALSTVARAADPAIVSAETSVRLGVVAGYGNVYDNPNPQDSEAGALLGVTAGVSALTTAVLPSTIWPDLYTEVGYDFSAQLPDHANGSATSPVSPQSAHDAYYNTAIVRLGAGTPISGGQELIPYIAGGYQNWHRHEGGPGDIGDYYQAELAGGGLRLDVTASPALVLSAAAEGFAVIGGLVSAPSENFDARFGTTAEERVSLGADYRLSRTWHAFAGFGVTHYEYSGSQFGGVRVPTPFSSTLQVNSMFGLAYGF
jgi:hypothetical protein